MPFETSDFISKIPVARFQSETWAFTHDQLAPPGLDFTQLAEEMWRKYQSGDITGAMVDSIVERFGRASHEENVAWGEQIQALRGSIQDTAQTQGIDLFAVSQGRQILSDELMSQFQLLHETATTLALKNFKLVAFFLSHTPSGSLFFDRTPQDLQDLIQEGWLAIYEVALKYNPWHKTKYTGNPEDALHFSSYAGKYITGKMRNYLPSFLHIKIGSHNVDEFNIYQRIKGELNAQGRAASHAEIVARVKLRIDLNIEDPTDEEVAEYLAGAKNRNTLGRIARRFNNLIRAVQARYSDDPVVRSFRDSQGEWITAELEPVEPSASGEIYPDVEAHNAILAGKIRETLDVLTPRERKVLEMRFGLKDGVDHTLEEVGKQFNLTREAIRQIEGKALRKLRHPIRSKNLRDLIE